MTSPTAFLFLGMFKAGHSYKLIHIGLAHYRQSTAIP